MDSQYQLTDRADGDLFEALLYLARVGSIKTAEKFLKAVHKKFAPGLRSIPEGCYVIFYRSSPENILIIRVLHGSQDTSRAFGGPEPDNEDE